MLIEVLRFLTYISWVGLSHPKLVIWLQWGYSFYCWYGWLKWVYDSLIKKYTCDYNNEWVYISNCEPDIDPPPSYTQAINMSKKV